MARADIYYLHSSKIYFFVQGFRKIYKKLHLMYNI